MWQMTSTTSNTFTVMMTVGFFEVRGEVLDPITNTTRVYLGKEMFQSVPGDLRQKYVSVVDRSYIARDAATATDQTQEKVWFNALAEDVKPGDTTAKMYCNAAGEIYVQNDNPPPAMPNTLMTTSARSTIRLGFGDNAINQADGETVTLTPTPAVWTNGVGTFTISAAARYHPAGSPVTNVLLGNPGPQPGFDYRLPRYKNTVVQHLVKVSGP